MPNTTNSIENKKPNTTNSIIKENIYPNSYNEEYKQHLLSIIQEKGSYDKDEFAKKYGTEVIEIMLSNGMLIESPKGVLRAI